MSRRSRTVERPSAHTEPDWPTTVRGNLSGGRVHGTDGSVWLYYTVPLGIVEDAKSVTESLLPGHPLRNAFDQLGAMATPRFNRRQSAKSTYRRVRLLLVNLPGIYQSSNSGALGTFQNTAFAGEPVPRRILVLGVRLAPRMGSGGLRSAVDSMVTFMAAQGIPLSDFDEDFTRVSQTLSRCGLSVPTDDEMDVLASWWSTRRNRATPMLSHPAHLHVFDDVHSTEAAARIGVSDCTGWTDLPGQYQLTVASVSQLLLGLRSADDPWTRWVDHLRRENLLALSIQGLVEPAKVTAAELRRVRKQYNADISERFNQNKLNRGDQDEMLHELTEFEQAYQTGGPPTLIDGSVLVALNGGRHDLSRRATMQPYELAEMAYRQTVGLAEMWLASPVLANPHLHDMPAPAIAYSGIAGLSRVGDADGAQVGLTVTDRQPSYLSRTAASRGDRATCMLVVGQTGSGKSFVLQWLACQFAKERDDDGRPPPQLIFDPKRGSDFSEMVRAAGGRVVSLDDLISTDGVLDPMRSDEPERHIDEAAEMIMFVNPWGSRADDSYTALLKALKGRCNGRGPVHRAGAAPRPGPGRAGRGDPAGLRSGRVEPTVPFLHRVRPRRPGIGHVRRPDLHQGGPLRAVAAVGAEEPGGLHRTRTSDREPDPPGHPRIRAGDGRPRGSAAPGRGVDGADHRFGNHRGRQDRAISGRSCGPVYAERHRG